MRKVLLAVLLLAGCGSVEAEGPEQVVACSADPSKLPSDCTAESGAVTGPGGQPAIVYRCGSMVALVEQQGAPPYQTVLVMCCIDNVPSATDPDTSVIAMCP